MQRSSARRSKNIPFSVCRRQGDSSLPSGCTQQPSEITRQGRGKSAEKEPEKRIKDLPFRSADRQPRERRHTENHMPKRQQWQNTHRLPSIQREVPQMPVLTVPLEDRKSRPLRKEADAISLLHSHVGCRKQQQYTEGHTGRKPEGKKTNICILIPFSHLLFAPPYFLPYCQCIHGS